MCSRSKRRAVSTMVADGRLRGRGWGWAGHWAGRRWVRRRWWCGAHSSRCGAALRLLLPGLGRRAQACSSGVAEAPADAGKRFFTVRLAPSSCPKHKFVMFSESHFLRSFLHESHFCSPLRTAPRPQSIQSIQSTQSIQSIQSLAIRGAVSPPCLLLSFQISHPPTPRIWIKIEIHGANGRVVVARYFVGLG